MILTSASYSSPQDREDYVNRLGRYLIGHDRTKVKVLGGGKHDIRLADSLIKGNVKTRGYCLLVSFHTEDRLTAIQKECLLQDLKTFLLMGVFHLREDEYIFHVVQHLDTNNMHFHISIPNLDLRTGKPLNLYFKSKVKYMHIIQQYLEVKYNLKRDGEQNIISYKTGELTHQSKQAKARNRKKRELHTIAVQAILNGEVRRGTDWEQFWIKKGMRITRHGKNYITLAIADQNGKEKRYKLKGKIYGKQEKDLQKLIKESVENKNKKELDYEEIRKKLIESIKKAFWHDDPKTLEKYITEHEIKPELLQKPRIKKKPKKYIIYINRKTMQSFILRYVAGSEESIKDLTRIAQANGFEHKVFEQETEQDIERWEKELKSQGYNIIFNQAKEYIHIIRKYREYKRKYQHQQSNKSDYAFISYLLSCKYGTVISAFIASIMNKKRFIDNYKVARYIMSEREVVR